MRRFVLPLLCVGLLMGLGACGSDTDQSDSPLRKSDNSSSTGTSYKTDPVSAPDLSLEMMDGQTLNLAKQNGNVILVNFWATWCAPCRREIPDLVDLYSELNSDGLVIVGIAVDREGAEVVKPFVKEEDINYPIVLDPDQSAEKHFDAMYGLPTTYVINPDGKIVRRITGIFPTEEMKPMLKDMLDSADASPSA
jgi:peroxiredoxin